ncbi:zinc-binding protein A33-like [Cheilinus undulatus]|uniref:zinc-binding protein A33-like n=1 Tax=Cheilinus undulatus TaxID=241271 RepID=UPI001BD4BD41|nr:zinc-binding protein A33-like [Cheilinus undulatus]
MAATSSLSEEDLLCPLCSQIYSLPVLLNCGHNFCKVCLGKSQEWKEYRVCPVCRYVAAPGKPPINLELKIAVDEYQEQKNTRDLEVCCTHLQKMTLFCHNDEEPICLACQSSMRHKVHECSAVEEAARKKKTEISDLLEPLKKKLRVLTKTKDQWEETKNYIQTQAFQCERAIKEEFEQLHQFLQKEESKRLKALKQEEEMKKEVMSKKLDNIKDQIRTLSKTISDTEKSLRGRDLAFLQDYKQTKKSVKCIIREPECIRDILINSAQHLGLLRYKVWRKMADIINHVPITLDPNTAQSNLRITEELTCMEYSNKQLLPDNPERCTNRVCVLGAAGFTWGKHSWTVDVGQGKDWNIGVVQESINRKTAVFLNPTEGFWVISLQNGDSYWAETSPRTKLVLKQKPEKITVKVDYDKGKVAFINAVDLTTIHIFNDRFTEKLFPYFSPGLYNEEKISSPLKICSLKIQVQLE